MATNPNVTVDPATGKTKEYNFRACFIDPFQGTVMANFAKNDLQATKAAILIDNSSDYAKGLAAFFKENFIKNGGTVVAEESYLQKDTDFKATLTKIKAAAPDILYVPGYYQEVGMIVKHRTGLQIYGDDYPTKDGTNVRDYVHVVDLADAHVLALKYLNAGNQSSAFNIGSAHGFSNMEILNAARKVTGQKIPATVGPRRAGDPSTLVASSEKARDILGWKPNYDDIDKIIETAWKWHENHPEGFGDRN